MTDIIIYSDFDGTLTLRTGNDTVSSPFYQSLLEGYTQGIQQHYKNTALKSETEIQQLFTAKFGTYGSDFDHNATDADMLITPEAVTFLHEVLKSDQIQVRIVTKNRKDYIQALLQYQGFSAEEIFKLEILDSGHKFTSVHEDLKKQPKADKIKNVYALDDTAADLFQMVLACKMHQLTDEQIKQYRLQPGQFAWLDYLRAIQESLSSASTVTQTTVTSILAEDEEEISALTTSFSKHVALRPSTNAAATPEPEPVQHFENLFAGASPVMSESDDQLAPAQSIRTPS